MILFCFKIRLNVHHGQAFYTEYNKNKNGNSYCRLVPNHSIPEWWNSYNEVKHLRTGIDKKTKKENFTKANFRNICQAYSALFLLECSYIHYLQNNGATDIRSRSNLFEKSSY